MSRDLTEVKERALSKSGKGHIRHRTEQGQLLAGVGVCGTGVGMSEKTTVKVHQWLSRMRE